MAPYTISVAGRGKRIAALSSVVDLKIDPTDSLEHLHQQIAASIQYSIHQIRLSKDKEGKHVLANSPFQTLEAAGLRDGSQVFVKDLGLQISWRTVYIIEYIGALVAHPLIYGLRLSNPTSTQTLLLCLMLIHFIKRELETVFVHRFSNATMPLRNIFKNSFHYWILSGLLLSWSFYNPAAENSNLSTRIYIGLVVFTVGELANLYIHLILRRLRPAGTTERGIPQGIGFQWVTCPNYFYETVAWIGVLIIYPCWPTLFFIVVAVAQMRAWAYKKEMRYRREFGDKYQSKKSFVLPGIC